MLAALLLQAGLIMFLLHERKSGTMPKWNRGSGCPKLAHVNRQATAGELSSSIAHELNQPLGSILTNAETAELILKSDNRPISRRSGKSWPTSGATTSAPAK